MAINLNQLTGTGYDKDLIELQECERDLADLDNPLIQKFGNSEDIESTRQSILDYRNKILNNIKQKQNINNRVQNDIEAMNEGFEAGLQDKYESRDTLGKIGTQIDSGFFHTGAGLAKTYGTGKQLVGFTARTLNDDKGAAAEWGRKMMEEGEEFNRDVDDWTHWSSGYNSNWYANQNAKLLDPSTWNAANVQQAGEGLLEFELPMAVMNMGLDAVGAKGINPYARTAIEGGLIGLSNIPEHSRYIEQGSGKFKPKQAIASGLLSGELMSFAFLAGRGRGLSEAAAMNYAQQVGRTGVLGMSKQVFKEAALTGFANAGLSGFLGGATKEYLALPDNYTQKEFSDAIDRVFNQMGHEFVMGVGFGAHGAVKGLMEARSTYDRLVPRGSNKNINTEMSKYFFGKEGQRILKEKYPNLFAGEGTSNDVNRFLDEVWNAIPKKLEAKNSSEMEALFNNYRDALMAQWSLGKLEKTGVKDKVIARLRKQIETRIKEALAEEEAVQKEVEKAEEQITKNDPELSKEQNLEKNQEIARHVEALKEKMKKTGEVVEKPMTADDLYEAVLQNVSQKHGNDSVIANDAIAMVDEAIKQYGSQYDIETFANIADGIIRELNLPLERNRVGNEMMQWLLNRQQTAPTDIPASVMKPEGEIDSLPVQGEFRLKGQGKVNKTLARARDTKGADIPARMAYSENIMNPEMDTGIYEPVPFEFDERKPTTVKSEPAKEQPSVVKTKPVVESKKPQPVSQPKTEPVAVKKESAPKPNMSEKATGSKKPTTEKSSVTKKPVIENKTYGLEDSIEYDGKKSIKELVDSLSDSNKLVLSGRTDGKNSSYEISRKGSKKKITVSKDVYNYARGLEDKKAESVDDGFNGFLKGKQPFQKGAAKKALNKVTKYDGKTVKEVIDQLAKEGTLMTEVDTSKKGVKTFHVGASDPEGRYRFGEYFKGKTVYEYAEYMKSKMGKKNTVKETEQKFVPDYKNKERSEWTEKDWDDYDNEQNRIADEILGKPEENWTPKVDEDEIKPSKQKQNSQKALENLLPDIFEKYDRDSESPAPVQALSNILRGGEALADIEYSINRGEPKEAINILRHIKQRVELTYPKEFSDKIAKNCDRLIKMIKNDNYRGKAIKPISLEELEAQPINRMPQEDVESWREQRKAYLQDRAFTEMTKQEKRLYAEESRVINNMFKSGKITNEQRKLFHKTLKADYDYNLNVNQFRLEKYQKEIVARERKTFVEKYNQLIDQLNNKEISFNEFVNQRHQLSIDYHTSLERDGILSNAMRRTMIDPNRNKPNLSTREKITGKTMNTEQLNKVLESPTVKKIKETTNLNFKVVDSVDELRKMFPDADIKDTAEAGISGDTIYLVNGNISRERLPLVLAHEVAGHRGIEAIIGSDPHYKDFFARLEKAAERDGFIRDAFREVDRLGYAKEERAREAMAKIIEKVKAEDGTLKGTAKAFVSFIESRIRRFVRDLGFNVKLSKGEVYDLAIQALRRTGMKNSNKFFGLNLFHSDDPTFRSATSTELDQKSLSSPVESQQFKNWFGDWKNDPLNASKIVDEDGTPRIVYHGTDAKFDAFDYTKGRSGMDIQGMFFSPWEIDAKGYGKNVGQFYLNMRNPANEDIAYKALRKFQGQNYAGKKAREYLIEQGYDGVIMGVEGQPEEYIAFYPNQIKSATDNIGTFDRNNNKFRASIGGEKAKTANIAKLEEAKKRLKDGEDKQKVWEETGWYIAKDGKPRFEISDRDFKISDIAKKVGHGEYPLGRLIDHKELFKAYPELEKMIVNVEPKGENELRGGSYNTENNEITVYVQGDKIDSMETKKTIIHEVQHAIQEIENFAKGTSLEQAYRDLKKESTKKMLDAIESLKDEDTQNAARTYRFAFQDFVESFAKSGSDFMKAIEEKDRAENYLLEKLSGKKLDPNSDTYRKDKGEISKEYNSLFEAIRNGVKHGYGSNLDPQGVAVYDRYKKAYGEGESRAVENRLALFRGGKDKDSGEFLRKHSNMPEQDFDYDVNDSIINFDSNGGNSESRKVKPSVVEEAVKKIKKAVGDVGNLRAFDKFVKKILTQTFAEYGDTFKTKRNSGYKVSGLKASWLASYDAMTERTEKAFRDIKSFSRLQKVASEYIRMNVKDGEKQASLINDVVKAGTFEKVYDIIYKTNKTREKEIRKDLLRDFRTHISDLKEKKVSSETNRIVKDIIGENFTEEELTGLVTSNAFTNEALNKLRNVAEDMRSELSNIRDNTDIEIKQWAINNAAEITKELREIIKKRENSPSANISVEKLSRVNHILGLLSNYEKKAKEALDTSIKNAAVASQQKILGEFDKIKPVDPNDPKNNSRDTNSIGVWNEIGKPGTALENLNNDNFTAKMGKEMNKIGYEDMLKGQDIQDHYRALGYETADNVEKVFGKDIKDGKKFLGKTAMKVDTNKGFKYDLTYDDMLSLVATYMDKETQNLIKRAGKVELALGDKRDSDFFTFTPKQLDEMVSRLTPKDKEALRITRGLFTGEFQPKLNEVHERLNGVPLRESTETEYFPRYHIREGDSVSDKGIVTKDKAPYLFEQANAQGQGMLKQRNKYAVPRLRLRGLTDVIRSYTDQAALYIGMAEPLRNFNRVMTDSMKREITRRFGIEYTKRLERMVDLKAGMGGKTESDSNTVAKYLSNLAAAKLTPVSALKQFSSVFLASSHIDYKYLAKAALSGLNSENIKEMMQLDAMKLRYRNDGLAGIIPLNAKNWETERLLEKHGDNWFNKFVDWGLNLSINADKRALGIIYKATKLMAEDMGKGSDKAWIEKKFMDTVRHTQNTTDLASATGWQERSRGSSVWAFANMYLNQTQKIANEYFRLKREIADVEDRYGKNSSQYKEAKGRMTNYVIGIALMNAMTIGAGSLASSILGNNKDDDKKNLKQKALGLATDSAMNLVGNPVLRTALGGSGYALRKAFPKAFGGESTRPSASRFGDDLTGFIPDAVYTIGQISEDMNSDEPLVQRFKKIATDALSSRAFETSLAMGRIPTWFGRYPAQILRNRLGGSKESKSDGATHSWSFRKTRPTRSIRRRR